MVWEARAFSSIISEPKISPDNSRLLSISEIGEVECRGVQDGTPYWVFACNFVTAYNCVPSVRAEFTLSPDGMILYYGDVGGNIRALRIGNPVDGSPPLTEYPSEAPLPTVSNRPTVVGYTQPPIPPDRPPTIGPFRSPTPLSPTISSGVSLSSGAAIVAAVQILILSNFQ